MLVTINTEKLLNAKEFDWVHNKTARFIVSRVKQIAHDLYDESDDNKDLAEIMALIDCIEVRDSEIDQTLENLIKLTRRE